MNNKCMNQLFSIILRYVVSNFRDVTHMTESSTTNLFKDISSINFVSICIIVIMEK